MKLLKRLLFIFSLIPLVYLIYGVFTGSLGPNPIEYVLHSSGWWGLTFLIISLSITPVRKIAGCNKIIQLRRMLGLFAFFYITLHFLIYLGLDRLFALGEIGEDILKRPYITVGFTAFILLIPLAVTSTKNWIRKLGKRWQKLHQLVYVAAVLGVIHFWWLVKKDITEPLMFAIMLSVLFLVRIIMAKRKTK